MSIQIFILSKLMEDNTYPYKLKKQLSEPIPLDKLGGLTESKLYYHFDSLAKQGLIEAVEIIKEEHRPDKQVFQITAKGRQELPKKIYKVMKNAEKISDMVVCLANIKYVDRDKVVSILEDTLEKITERWEEVQAYDKLVQRDEDKEQFIDFVSGYVTTRTEHTIHWMKELIKRVKQGDF
ncbi:PadR family transcriptional regulator [Terribacillus halophilus]|uniref:PadR family transcriptional regulator n=1 Tax=Terribacillus halophilus TaxID=361279 RepID=UPI003981D8A1